MPETELADARGDLFQFNTTLWGVVRLAGQGDESQARSALETLCRRYWYPLYAFARRRGTQGSDGIEEARDLTQGFFTHLLDRRLLARADESRGRFRSFLLKSFTRFMQGEWDRARAAKRGGGAQAISLDAAEAETRYGLEPADENDPEKIYERRWAVLLIERALENLEKQFQRAGKAREFTVLKPLLLAEESDATCLDLARQLGQTPNAVRVSLHRMRQRYQQLFREEVSETVSTESELEEELQHIFRILSK